MRFIGLFLIALLACMIKPSPLEAAVVAAKSHDFVVSYTEGFNCMHGNESRCNADSACKWMSLNGGVYKFCSNK